MRSIKANLLFVALYFIVSSAAAAETAAQPASPDYLVIQVNGIVCSFCAYGTEKNLRRLEFLDKTQYGGDGVLVNINAHTITLALQRQLPVQYAQINAAILKGGYDPIAYYAMIRGVIRAGTEEGTVAYQLVNEDNGQVYSLPSGTDLDLQPGRIVSIRTVLTPAQTASLSDGQAISLSSVERQL